LGPYHQAVLDACITHVLAPMGMAVASTEWGKALGQGLYELRIRRSLHAIRTWGVFDPQCQGVERFRVTDLVRPGSHAV
jgi:hypothetical protein